jgi:hypothetical protein
LYDPKINRSYTELGAHYGVLVDPARAFKPKDKARVERPMPYVRDLLWRGREFTSLEDMRAAALGWSSDVAGQRACRPLGGAAPAAVFAAVEAPALAPLPVAPFVLATWSAAKVGPDFHLEVGATLYSLPWRYLGDRVDARSTTSMVQFFRHGELIKTHPRKERGKQTDLNDYPPEKIAFHTRTPTWCRHRAAEIGPACEAVIGELLTQDALFRLGAAQGVLGLADKHDPGRLEAACAKATAAGDPSYRTIKGILAAGTETANTAARPGPPRPPHPPSQPHPPATSASLPYCGWIEPAHYESVHVRSHRVDSWPDQGMTVLLDCAERARMGSNCKPYAQPWSVARRLLSCTMSICS